MVGYRLRFNVSMTLFVSTEALGAFGRPYTVVFGGVVFVAQQLGVLM